MQTVATIQGVSITLHTAGEQRLFIQITADGPDRSAANVKRMGNGTVDDQDRELYIGRTDEPMLTDVLVFLDDEMLKYCGGYDVPNRRGVECVLRIEFLFADGTTNGFGVRYGSQSDGPPRELTKFVQHAVETTNRWRAENFAKPE